MIVAALFFLFSVAAASRPTCTARKAEDAEMTGDRGRIHQRFFDDYIDASAAVRLAADHDAAAAAVCQLMRTCRQIEKRTKDASPFLDIHSMQK